MAQAQVGDIRLHYVERGTGRPLLLAHGFPLDHSMWDRQLDGLSQTCRVIAPDLRGFGGSDVTAGTVTMQQYADDLAALLDALAIREPIVFCGLSMGGYVAWQFWRRFANRLAGLVLCDTRAAADTAEAAENRRKTADHVLAHGALGLVETMTPKLFARETAQNQPAIITGMRKVMEHAPPAGIAAALRGMAERPDMSSFLHEIQVPTLLVCGEQDVISPPNEMRAIAERLPHAKFVEVPRAGHMSPLEQPDFVNSELRNWFESLSR